MKDQKPLGTVISISGEVAHVLGIDNGPNVTVEARNDECIVLKIGGHSYWSGQGTKDYEPTERSVFRILKKLDEGRYRVEPLITYPTRKV